ncbi:hypothetical protein KAX75_04865 [candidate division WOR-3 bacterium]|nr:hypothetical protein [candidate division WOR-3 bacterium]
MSSEFENCLKRKKIRALLYAKNYRERSHYCLIVAMRTLYVEKKLLPLHLGNESGSDFKIQKEAGQASRYKIAIM